MKVERHEFRFLTLHLSIYMTHTNSVNFMSLGTGIITTEHVHTGLLFHAPTLLGLQRRLSSGHWHMGRTDICPAGHGSHTFPGTSRGLPCFAMMVIKLMCQKSSLALDTRKNSIYTSYHDELIINCVTSKNRFLKKTPETSLKISQLTFPKDISPLRFYLMLKITF